MPSANRVKLLLALLLIQTQSVTAIATVPLSKTVLSKSAEQSPQQKSPHEELAQKLLAADNDDQRRQLLAAEPALVTLDLAKALISLGAARYLSRPAEAEYINTAFRFAYEIAKQAKDTRTSAEAINNLCLAKHQQGVYEEALGYCNEAHQLFSSIPDKLGLARVYDRLGMVNSSLGNYQIAKNNFEDALKVREQLNEPDRTAKTLNEYAVFNMRLGNYQEAVSLLQRALSLREEISQKNPDNKDNKSSKLVLLANLGLAYGHQGFYALALRQYEKSREIAIELQRDSVLISGDIGSMYKKQGNLALALQYYSESLAARERIGSQPEIISALLNLGEVCQATGDWKKSLEHHEKAVALSERGANKRLICSSNRFFAGSLFRQQLYDQALAQSQKTLGVCDPNFNKGEIAEVTAQMATIYAIQQDLARAAAFADQAYEVISNVEGLDLKSSVLAMIGRVYLSANQTEKARKVLLESISAIEQLRNNVAGSEEQRQAFFETQTAPYQTLAELQIAQQQPVQALAYSEAAKARVLLDVMQSGKLNLSQSMTSAEQEQERKLNNNLTLLNKQLFYEQTRLSSDKAKESELTKHIEKARLDYEDFRTRLYAAHPELKAKRGEAKTLTLAEAADLLPDEKTALLEYLVTPEHSHLFVITKSKTGEPKLQTFPLAIKRDDLATKVEQFRSQLAGRDARFGKLAGELYSQLLKPAKAMLPAQARLVIVPDGPLWELPFQALLNERSRYVLQDHVLSYAPSLTVLREMAKARREPAAQKQSLLAIGDPKFGGQSLARAQALMGTTFGPLPGARAQVETLQKLYDASRSKVFIGEAATEEQYKAEAGKYDILHFATHGVLNDRNPLYSHLLLAQPEAGGNNAKEAKEDGLLEAWELMQMDLRADLAVLSACETARGRIGAGEGMIGLTWAMFVAGVPTTVVSQWKVLDTSTADLMVEFHRLLQARSAKGEARWIKAEALQQAAMKLLATPKYRHPFYWAGFVLVGKP